MTSGYSVRQQFRDLKSMHFSKTPGCYASKILEFCSILWFYNVTIVIPPDWNVSPSFVDKASSLHVWKEMQAPAESQEVGAKEPSPRLPPPSGPARGRGEWTCPCAQGAGRSVRSCLTRHLSGSSPLHPCAQAWKWTSCLWIFYGRGHAPASLPSLLSTLESI